MRLLLTIHILFLMIADPCGVAAASSGVHADTLSLGVVEVVRQSQSEQTRATPYTVSSVDIRGSINRLLSVNDLAGRAAGITLRRQGGRGSDYELSLNGLSGNAIRYFVDGIPLDTRGQDAGLDNIPVAIIDRVEIYKGIVPPSLGGDALGGAVNIITRKSRSDYLEAAVGGGSFGTVTGDLAGQIQLGRTPVKIRPSLSVDHSLNSYRMRDVEVWDEVQDRYVLTDCKRFHDRYLSLAASLEAGVDEVGWADAFYVSVTGNLLRKQLQTGAMQNKVYGNARRKAEAAGIGMRYAMHFGPVALKLNAVRSFDNSETVDTAMRKYSWDGSWQPSNSNEMNGKGAAWRRYRRPVTSVAAAAGMEVATGHLIGFDYSLNHTSNRRSDLADVTFEPTRDAVTKHIVALSYNQRLSDDKWQNLVFAKLYTNTANLKGDESVRRRLTRSYPGAGLASRYTFNPAVSVKASYEHSVRLPVTRELLGNGTTVEPNIDLTPEQGDNINLAMYGSAQYAGAHMLRYSAGGYLRFVRDYIRAQVSERDGLMRYVNEPAIHVQGLEGEIVYSYDSRLRLEANATLSDARDRRRFKSDGNPSVTFGNRVPNRPWLTANAGVSYTFLNPGGIRDRLTPLLTMHYVHWYYLNWAAYGAASSKAVIPSQLTMDLSVTYNVYDGRYNLSIECTNLFDRKVYDNYMLQKPGRALYAKVRVLLR